MDPRTRALFTAYARRVAQLNGVASAFEQFTVAPAVEQRLEAALRQESTFLQAINILPTRDLTGETIYAGTTGSIAGRTDTSGNAERTPREVHALDNESYLLKQTDLDTALNYSTLDSWSMLPNFQSLISAQIVSQIAEDRIMVGFNGTSAAATTNRVTNPLLQDVNRGWLQRYRDDSPQRVLTGGATAGRVQIGGTAADYENMDALVWETVRAMIHPRMIESPRLRVIVGRNTLDEKYFPLINTSNAPTEMNALDIVLSTKKVGGIPAMMVPFMPEGKMLITDPKNLSIYFQAGSRRRHFQDRPSKNRYESYESVNEGYAVEQYAAGCVIENIAFGDPVQQGSQT